MQTGYMVIDTTGTAEAAITLYQCVKFGTTAPQVNVASTGEDGIGFAQDAQAVVGGLVPVRIEGISRAYAYGSITKGKLCKAYSGGYIQQCSANAERVVCMALETASSGDVIDVLVKSGMYNAS